MAGFIVLRDFPDTEHDPLVDSHLNPEWYCGWVRIFDPPGTAGHEAAHKALMEWKRSSYVGKDTLTAEDEEALARGTDLFWEDHHKFSHKSIIARAAYESAFREKCGDMRWIRNP